MNLLRRLADLPGVRAVLLRPAIRRRLAAVLALRFLVAAFVTTTPVRLLVGEAARRGSVAHYRVRRTGIPVALVHGRDLEALFEIFVRGEYEPPAALTARLGADRVRTVLDVGANVGMFAAWARARWPAAEVVCVEPAPENTRVLRTVVGDDRTRLVEAAAATAEGEVTFVEGFGSGSRVGGDGASGITVPAVDILPFVAAADFVKIDIEGAEWPILADPRLADVGQLVLVMEYHRGGAPRLPARDTAVGLLEAAGFTVGHGHANHWGHGTLWAWKD